MDMLLTWHCFKHCLLSRSEVASPTLHPWHCAAGPHGTTSSSDEDYSPVRKAAKTATKTTANFPGPGANSTGMLSPAAAVRKAHTTLIRISEHEAPS
jgi:hypothetical protein